MSDSIDYSKTKEFEVEKSIQPENGQLRYLADHTKPDILAAVGLLGQVAAQPHQTHRKGIKHLARYLKGSREIPLILGGNDPEVEFGYVDASHLPDETSKPRVGFCYFLNLLFIWHDLRTIREEQKCLSLILRSRNRRHR
jgi:hypothetical protein